MDRSGLPLGLLSLGSQLQLEEGPTTAYGLAAAAEDARDACRSTAFWFWTDEWDEEMAKLRGRTDEYLPRATAWVAAQAAHPWEASLPDQRQLWVSAEGAYPDSGAFEPVGGYPGFGFFGPSGGGLWTSTEVPGMPCPLLEI